jgi:hypothetical protein
MVTSDLHSTKGLERILLRVRLRCQRQTFTVANQDCGVAERER